MAMLYLDGVEYLDNGEVLETLDGSISVGGGEQVTGVFTNLQLFNPPTEPPNEPSAPPGTEHHRLNLQGDLLLSSLQPFHQPPTELTRVYDK